MFVFSVFGSNSVIGVFGQIGNILFNKPFLMDRLGPTRRAWFVSSGLNFGFLCKIFTSDLVHAVARFTCDNMNVCILLELVQNVIVIWNVRLVLYGCFWGRGD